MSTAMWDEVELGDIVTLHRGYDLPFGQRRDGPVPVVSSSGITGYHNEAKISPPGVVTGRYGTLGEVFFVEEPFWPLNTTLYVSDFHGNDQRFVSYFLRCQGLGSQDGAAAVPGINRNVLHRLPARRPPLATQRKIAAILAAYDDLIENNNRRVKLLEEMAQRIYHEWFVDFRYPGHENVPLVDSELGPIPEGWSVKRMDVIAEVIDCLHSKKPESTEAGTGILLQLFNIGSGGIVDLSQIYRVSDVDYGQWISRIELRRGDCVVTNVGRIAAVAQIPPGLKAAPGRNMTAIRPRTVPPTYLLQYLLSEHMDHEVQKKKDAGSIMDSLNVKGIVKLAVPVPSEALATRFEQLARPLRHEMELLIARQQNLRITRNLVLPRLISGEIDVTDLDIAIPEAAA